MSRAWPVMRPSPVVAYLWEDLASQAHRCMRPTSSRDLSAWAHGLAHAYAQWADHALSTMAHACILALLRGVWEIAWSTALVM